MPLFTQKQKESSAELFRYTSGLTIYRRQQPGVGKKSEIFFRKILQGIALSLYLCPAFEASLISSVG
jgi:hypothetical protein